MRHQPTVATPQRLLRTTRGVWRLQLQHLVYAGRSVLRPQRFEVEGEDAILEQLRQLSSGEPLAREAQRLFTGAEPASEEDEAAFTVSDGRWVAERRLNISQDKSNADGVVRVAALRKRIESLEGKLKSVERELIERKRANNMLLHSDNSLPPAHASTSDDYVGQLSNEAAYDGMAGSAAPVAMPDADPDAHHEPAAIGLPALGSLTELIKSLAGSSAALNPTANVDWAAKQSTAYCSLILDETGPRGALVFDTECAIRLAGALLMQSPEEVAVLLEEPGMSEELRDAAGEVCNTLMSSFNRVSGNPHLKSLKLEAMDGERAEWIATARHVEHYRYAQGGLMSLIAR